MLIEHMQVQLFPNKGEPVHWMAAIADSASFSEPRQRPWLATLIDMGGEGFRLVTIAELAGRTWAFFAKEVDELELD